MDVVAKLKPTVVGEDRILRSHEKCEIPPITLVSLFAVFKMLLHFSSIEKLKQQQLLMMAMCYCCCCCNCSLFKKEKCLATRQSFILQLP